MNDKNKSAEFSYYGLYLLKYLRENHPNRASDTDFIEERADHAADVYEQSRLEGATPEGAQELAMDTLLRGLHYSRYAILREVVENEFADEVPPGDAPAFALTMLSAMEEVFARYPLADGFTYTAGYDRLYTELTGTVAIYLEEHGI